MPAAPETTIRCVTCEVEFLSTNSSAMKEHSDHKLVHIDPGGVPEI